MDLRWMVTLLFVSTLLTACGGGSEADDSQPVSSSHWDEMVWDQDSWE